MGARPMTNSVTREQVAAFYEAYASQDTGKLSALLDDDVEWIISGPVDLLAFCGTRHGKAAVIDLADRIVPSLYRVISLVQDSIILDGDRAATLNRMSARRCADGRVISYRLAHFMRFRDGKVVQNMSILDSFDAAEQMLGHSIGVHDEKSTDFADLPEVAGEGDLVAL